MLTLVFGGDFNVVVGLYVDVDFVFDLVLILTSVWVLMFVSS